MEPFSVCQSCALNPGLFGVSSDWVIRNDGEILIGRPFFFRRSSIFMTRFLHLNILNNFIHPCSGNLLILVNNYLF